MHAQVNGPEAWTGGRFGPEGSTFVEGFIVAAAAFYLWRVVVERKLTPAPWRARIDATPAGSAVVPDGPSPSGPPTHGL